VRLSERTETMQGLIGKKVGMTRIFNDDGKSISVTIIQTLKNVVHQVKTLEKDGYSAVQLGFGAVAETKVTKPRLGHFKKCGSVPTTMIKEFKLDSADEKIEPGSSVGVEILENSKHVDVIGVSKGRGFAGTIKRHHFMRGRETHGSGCTRERGSMGSNTYPAHVWPGLRMSGHMGSGQVTAKNLEVVGLDKDAGLVFLKGAVPGPTKGIVVIRKRKN
jgi:large subunit ribosomal protein L3